MASFVLDNTRLIDIMRAGLDLHNGHSVNPDMPLDEQEGGLMDFRQSNIIVRKKKYRNVFGVKLTFTCNRTTDIDGTIDEVAWCAKTDITDITDDYLMYIFDEYIEGSAKWIPNTTTLYFELDNKENKLRKETIIETLKYDILEDGPYEGMPGNFWIVPASEFK